MTFQVMNRAEAIRYSHKPHSEKTVVISIATDGEEYHSHVIASASNGVVGILVLWFDDVDGDGGMTKDDAVRIHRFVERHKDVNFIVQCDAGVSRSAGVAGALMKHYNGDDGEIFNDPKYRPNMRCYRMVLNELEGA